MAYQKPLVMVFQEYARMGVSGGSTRLSPCIVGPCYHIIDVKDDRTLSFKGAYQDLANLSSVSMPHQMAGAKLDKSSVKVVIESPIVALDSSPAAVEGVEDNIVTMTSITYNTDVQIGDLAILRDGSGDTVLSTNILGVSPAEHKYILARSVSEPIISGTIELLREEETLELTDMESSIDEWNNIDISVLDINSNTLIAGDVFIGYRALRTDLLKLNSAGTSDTVKGLLGKVGTKQNPLGMAVSLTLQNTITDVKFIGIREDNQAGYAEAQSLLESTDNVYGIVPLTQDVSVTSAFALHARQMSDPNIGMWRVAIINSPLPTNIVRQEGTGLPKMDIQERLLLFRDPMASFIHDGVAASDQLVLTANDGQEHTYTISGTVSEDTILIVEDEEIDKIIFDPDSVTPYDYTVLAQYTKVNQAEEIARVGKTHNNRKAVHVWPDVAEVNGQEVPGYYLACTVAGATAGLPPHQGFTRLSIAGVSKIKNSNDYFNREQLDTIAGGGTFIFTQQAEGAPPVIRHQLTTDMSTLEFRELSFVKNFDYVSILCKKTLDRFLGQYNITPATLGVLATAINAVLESLTLDSMPKIGSPVLGFDISEVYQLDSERDRVEIYCDVLFPNALNKIGLHLVSQ